MHILNLLLFVQLILASSQCAIVRLLIIVPSEISLSEGSPYKITIKRKESKCDRSNNVRQTLISEPYITWGPVNLKSVRDLIYKRGFVKVDGKRTPITSNDIIERKCYLCMSTHMLGFDVVLIN